MTDPFQAAWMMLKAGGQRWRAENEENSYGDTSYREHPLHGEEGYEENTRGGRGHSLDLRDMDIEGNPFNQGDDSAVNRLMEGRQNKVDEQGEHLRQFNHQGEGHGLRGGNEPVQDYRGATDRYRHESEAQDARGRLLERMHHNEAYQDAYGKDIERQIGEDEQRLGQQGEADEMEAMGVEPMGRQLGGKPPANIGQAGSTGGADPERYSINPFAMGEAMNTFRPTQEMKDWSQTHAPGPASAVGQAKHGHDDRSAMEAMEAWDESAEHAPLQSNDAFGSQPVKTLTDTPRHEKRGQEGAGRAFEKPKRPSWWRGE